MGTVAVAVAVTLAASAVSQSAQATVPPPSDPPATEFGTPIPADFVTVIDDTGTISVEVPSSWTEVDTTPDGVIPSIVASPDREAFLTSFDVTGVIYRADRFEEDTVLAARSFAPVASCDTDVVDPYDDGVFAGTHLTYSDCVGAGDVEVHVIAANPEDRSFTARLFIQVTSPDERPILQAILATFNVAIAEQPETAPVSVPSASTVAPTLAPAGSYPAPTGEIPGDWTTLVDDTATLSVAVPSTWTATDLAPRQSEDGSPQPWISATTDQESFLPPPGTPDTYSVPGVVARAIPFETDTAGRLTASVYNDECIPDPMLTYDDGRFVGHIQTFTDCGGTATRIVQLAANPPDEAFTAIVLIQLTGQADDDATLNGVLTSLTQANPSAAPPTSDGPE